MSNIAAARVMKTTSRSEPCSSNGYSRLYTCAQHEPITWWSRTGSNRRPHACKARALPTELRPLTVNALGAKRRKADRPPRPMARTFAAPPRTNQKTSSVGARSAPILVGLGRLERPTSPLSGVRSNHLSYRPDAGIVRTMLSEAPKAREIARSCILRRKRSAGGHSVPQYGRRRQADAPLIFQAEVQGSHPRRDPRPNGRRP